MIVCSCLAVSSDEIEELVDEGADTVSAVAAACGAGTDCGSCRQQIAEIIAVSRLLEHRPCPRVAVSQADQSADSAY
jgi:bacterioferritin-associated ferredoxin